MLNRSLLFAAAVLFAATSIERAPAVWRGPPQMLAALDDETRDWVQALRNKFGGGCCDTADGFPVEVDGWDIAGTADDTWAPNARTASAAANSSPMTGRLRSRRRKPVWCTPQPLRWDFPELSVSRTHFKTGLSAGVPQQW